MRNSADVPVQPHPVTVAEVIPGDLLALSEEDVAADRWYVVMHTLPENPQTIRLALRPPLGGSDHDRVFQRDHQVTVGCRRMDVAGIPEIGSADLEVVEFRDGDRVTSLRAVDPRAVEESYSRRWGQWYRDLESRVEEPVSDSGLRERVAREVAEGHVVRHLPRPRRAAAMRRRASAGCRHRARGRHAARCGGGPALGGAG